MKKCPRSDASVQIVTFFLRILRHRRVLKTSAGQRRTNFHEKKKRAKALIEGKRRQEKY